MTSHPSAPASPLGVGIIGAGPVTQAIHLPALARLHGVLEVRHVMDVDPAVAAAVARRVGANHSTSVEQLLADPAVDVVAICSPNRFHAEQVIASCRAGKRAVLCEKPFAMSGSEAGQISTVLAETGVPTIVGAMHTFDPGWLAACENWGDLPETAHTIRSSIVLPPNSRFEDFATEVITGTAPWTPDYADPEAIKGIIRGGVMGLAIHDLPLVRQFLPDFAEAEVLQASIVKPFGYVISLRAGDRVVELRSATSSWQPQWAFDVIGDETALKIDFTPSYVQAGSATARVSRGNATRTIGPFAHNGYVEQWRHLAGLARGTVQPPPAETLIDDLTFALSIADAAAELASAPQGSRPTKEARA